MDANARHRIRGCRPRVAGTLEDVHVRSSGVGNDEEPIVEHEAQSVRITDTSKHTLRFGVGVCVEPSALEDEDVVRVVVAHCKPAAVAAEREPVREVEPAAKQHVTFDEGAIRGDPGCR